MTNAGANNSKPEPYWQKTYRLLDDLRRHLSAVPAGELESLIGLFGEEFACLRRCEGGTWIAAYWRDGIAIEAEGRTPEKALEKLLYTRAGAEPATSVQLSRRLDQVGRTGDSISPTGAAFTPAQGKTP
jgi:hypothetical protein